MKVKKVELFSVIYSVLFSVLYFCGFEVFLDTIVGVDTMFGGVSIHLVSGFVFALACLAFYYISKRLRYVYDKIIDEAENQSKIKDLTENKGSFWGNFGLFIICWTPYFIIRFPGNYDHDTIWQIMEGYGLNVKTDHHPYFDTMIFTAFWRVGDFLGSHFWSLLLYYVIQTFVMAALFSLILCTLSKIGIDQRLITLCRIYWTFYSPVAMYVGVMAKDMLHGVFFLLFFMMTLEIIRTKGKCLGSLKFCAVFFMVSMLTMLTKKTGMYVLVMSLLVTFLFVDKKRIRMFFVSAFAVAVFVFGWSNALRIMNVLPGGEGEKMSVPSQQVAFYLKNCEAEMEEDDWEILRSVYSNPEEMKDVYDPVLADPEKNRWNGYASKEEKIRFLRWYLKKFSDHPYVFTKAFVIHISALIHVDTSGMEMESLLFYRDCIPTSVTASEMEHTYSAWGGGITSPEEIHSLMLTSYRSEKAKFLSRAFNVLYVLWITLFAPLFSKAMVAVWIPAFVLLYGFLRKNIRVIIALFPILLTTAALVMGPTLLPRYFVNSVYTLPLVCLLPVLMKEENRIKDCI